jgi:hypothetical protein
MEPESILHDHYDVRHRARAMAVKGEVITHFDYNLMFVFVNLELDVCVNIPAVYMLKCLNIPAVYVAMCQYSCCLGQFCGISHFMTPPHTAPY